MNTHSKTHPQAVRGYTLVEMAVVIVVLGITLAMSLPTFQNFNRAHQLSAGTQHVLGQLRLARQKAIGTKRGQRLTFAAGNYTVQDLVTSQTFGPFTYPKGIALDGANLIEGGVTGASIAALTDGRFSGSGEIVLRDVKGSRDTVSVQVSGLALIR